MNTELLRYSCQMSLPGFAAQGQHLLKKASVLVIGMGGLGCPCAQYLAAAGVGTLGLVDFDTVSVSNLHRQILYTAADTGKKKVAVAAERLSAQNPEVEIRQHNVKVTSQNIFSLLSPYDIIVDCTDNFDARYLINDAAVISAKPVVYGAIYQYEGQIAVWNLANDNGSRTPNYRDVFPDVDASQIPNCTEGGVIPTLAGIIGCMQANEVLKFLIKADYIIARKILVFDAQTMQSRLIKLGEATNTHITAIKDTVVAATISAAELEPGVSDNTLQLVDVRDEYEREMFDIGGLHIPLTELNERLDEIDTDKITVFYCATGKRSMEAVKLYKIKFPHREALSLEGGLKSWLENSSQHAGS